MSYTKTGEAHHQYKHGAGSTKIRHPLYLKWCAMKRRCFNKNEKCYKNWGGRGITVCEKWLSFENFARDMGPSFKPGLSLDRIDVNGNYEPNNCRWVTLAEQNRNKRSTNTRLVLERLLDKVKHESTRELIRLELQQL